MMNISDSIKWIVFTQKCKLCGKVIEKGKELCDECENNGLAVIGETCIYCGAEKKRCNCKKRRSFYDGIVSPYYYDKGVGVGLRRLKFSNKTYIAKIFSEEMSRVVKKNIMTFTLILWLLSLFQRCRSLQEGITQVSCWRLSFQRGLILSLKRRL